MVNLWGFFLLRLILLCLGVSFPAIYWKIKLWTSWRQIFREICGGNLWGLRVSYTGKFCDVLFPCLSSYFWLICGFLLMNLFLHWFLFEMRISCNVFQEVFLFCYFLRVYFKTDTIIQMLFLNSGRLFFFFFLDIFKRQII